MIQIPDGGPTFEGQLVEDQFTMLWLHHRRGVRMGFRVLLSGGAHARVAHRARVT